MYFIFHFCPVANDNMILLQAYADVAIHNSVMVEFFGIYLSDCFILFYS